jgi:hypothetical protein
MTPPMTTPPIQAARAAPLRRRRRRRPSHDRLGLAQLALARSVDAGNLLETLLVSAVAAILGLRAYLRATGYPQVGGGGLHVAHMLWGGLLMLVALVLLLAFLGHTRRRLAAVIGGLGFGVFVDELGKFITSDNNYFYKPTVGLLYVLFVVLFLAFRAIEHQRPFSPAEALANAADTLREMVLGGATRAERARALSLLEASGASGPLAEALRDFVAVAPKSAETKPSLPERAAERGRRLYERLVAWPWFGRSIIALFVFNAILGLVVVVAVGTILVAGVAIVLSGHADPELRANVIAELMAEAGASPAARVATLISGGASLAALGCTVMGAARLRTDRLAALRWFKRSVLLSLLLGLPFQFFLQEFGALGGLARQLVLLVGVDYLLRQEVAQRAGRPVLGNPMPTGPMAAESVPAQP